MTLSHAQPKEPAPPYEQLFALCAAVREKSNENGENFKVVQYCKLLLSYSNQSTAAINTHLFIYLFNSLHLVPQVDVSASTRQV
jgi:hypothetical protein